jgi:hypothetical protein
MDWFEKLFGVSLVKGTAFVVALGLMAAFPWLGVVFLILGIFVLGGN